MVSWSGFENPCSGTKESENRIKSSKYAEKFDKWAASAVVFSWLLLQIGSKDFDFYNSVMLKNF